MDAPSATDFADVAERPELADEPGDVVEESSDRVVLGVAGYVADGLGVDALWVRLAFVLLALAGGVGVVLYLSLWLVVFGPDRTGLGFPRYVGGAVAIVGVPLMITVANLDFVNGPVAVVALLVGLMLALWQPRRTTASPVRHSLPPLAAAPVDELQIDGGTSEAPVVAPRHRRVRRVRQRREPSMLGRLTFGLAVIAAAIGALIDQLNGGRLHPEQWLGAAALVCGVGLLVGAIRGRAWWLIVPALLFAGTGYVAGIMSRLGIDATDGFGNQSVDVSEGRPGGTESIQRAFGTVWISVDGTPAEPLTIDATVAIGGVEMSLADNVAVEIRGDSDRGDLVVNGEVVPAGVRRLGPDVPPQVVVDARVGIGDVNVFTYNPGERFADQTAGPLLGAGPFDPLVLVHGQGIQVGDGVGISTDGWVVIANGEALLDPDNAVVVGDSFPNDDLTLISTSMGQFIVNGSELVTPTGTTYDLGGLRQQYGFEVGTASPNVLPDPPSPSTIPPATQTTIGG